MGLQNMEENRTISISQYYGSLPNMKSKFDRFARKDFFQGQTREEWEKWAQDSRKTLADLLGLDKMDHVPLMSRLVETVTAEPGIKREKVLIQTEEDVEKYLGISTLAMIPLNEAESRKKKKKYKKQATSGK